MHVHFQSRTVSYRRFTVALEHVHTRMLLDFTREEVETHTHGIIHLEHHVEV
jgi:hypothetical protein